MLHATGLGCERDRRQLFSALDFSLAPSQVLQVTGPNGSGKTTLLKILMGLYTEFEGEVDWALEQSPLYLGHRPSVSPRLTVIENLDWLCGLYDRQVDENDMDEVLAALGLDGYQDTFCNSLSEGQRKRVNLARFILCPNKCWIMDEPFSSIDTLGLGYLQDRMQDHVAGGGSIILTSHQALTLDTQIHRLELNP